MISAQTHGILKGHEIQKGFSFVQALHFAMYIYVL